MGPSQPARLYTWNSTVAFPNKTVDSGKLLRWTLRQDSQVGGEDGDHRHKQGFQWIVFISY